MSIFAPMIADLHFGDNHPINLTLVALQISLSNLLTEVMTWKAGNVLFGDLCNLSKGTTVEQVQDFLYLLQVYGHQGAINYFDPKIYTLSMQREHTRNNLFMIVTRIKAILVTIPTSAGYLKKDCEAVFRLITKVEKQY
jgi:hypothetical protein